MKNKIHYEEDLFFLNLQMKLLREGFQLQIDADFFLDKTLADLRFLDSCLGRLFSILKDNDKLIKRAEYFYNLVKAETAFTDLLQELLDGKFAFCENLAPYREDFSSRLACHRADISEIRETLKILTSEDEGREDVITQEELHLLTEPVSPEEGSR